MVLCVLILTYCTWKTVSPILLRLYWVYLPISSTHCEEPSHILPKCVRRAEEDIWRKDSVLPAGIKILKSPLRWVQNWSACMVIYLAGLRLSFGLFPVECWMNGESRFSRGKKRASEAFILSQKAQDCKACLKLAKADAVWVQDNEGEVVCVCLC